MLHTAQPDLVGQLLGRYRVTACLGEGGMGAVYRAEHEGIGSLVAIKVLHPALASDPDIVARFFNEARAVNVARHPNIVRIFDFVERSPAGAYLVMEYLEGESLQDHLERLGALSPAHTAAIVSRIAAALTAAHDQQIVHRDLKPANIFLLPDADHPGEQRVKVLDFGIAKLASGSGTQTHALMGTPHYMSPEQCHGAKQVDHRSDIYALGVIAYRCLAGSLPFDGEGSGEIMGKHMYEPPVPLRQAAPSLSGELETVVMQTLAKNPVARPPTAATFASALSGSAAAQQGTAAPIPATLVPAAAPTARRASPAATPLAAAISYATPRDAPDHLGNPQPPDADFFVPPPASIGALRSAATTLSTDLSAARRPALVKSALVGLGVALFFVLLPVVLGATKYFIKPQMIGIPIFWFAVSFVVAYRTFRFQAMCNYVAEAGVAEYYCKGKRSNVVARAELRFTDADELRVTTVRSFTNGLYTGTTHTLVWSDKLRPVFAITAAFDDRKHDGGARGERWFCDAAEQAWADYIVPRLVAQIDAGQRARFSLGGDDRLELTNDAIYAYRSGLEIRYTPGELAPITVESGILTITRAGEKPKLRIGPDSGVRVEYGAVGNAAAFLALARQLFGSAVVP